MRYFDAKLISNFLDGLDGTVDGTLLAKVKDVINRELLMLERRSETNRETLEIVKRYDGKERENELKLAKRDRLERRYPYIKEGRELGERLKQQEKLKQEKLMQKQAEYEAWYSAIMNAE